MSKIAYGDKVTGTTTPVTADNMNEIKASVNALYDISPAKKFAAILSQTGTAIPTLAIKHNSLGGVPVMTRTGVGSYYLTLAGAFTQDKTFVNPLSTVLPIGNKTVFISNQDTNTLAVIVRNMATGEFADLNIVDSVSLEISVYP